MSVGDDVMISVDPHKASNTLAVMDPVTMAVIARQRFVNSAGGVRRLREFAGGWADRRWAVEGCHGAGRGLAQRLVGDGEVVLDVPAKLAARVRVYSQGHGRKTDADDAVSIGLAALNSTGVAVVRRDDILVSLRLLCDRRDELGALRTQAVCRLHRLLCELTAGGTHRGVEGVESRTITEQTPSGRPGRGGAMAAGSPAPRRHPGVGREDESRPRADRCAGRRHRHPAHRALRHRTGHRRPDSGRGRHDRPIPIERSLRVV
jgi:Transposase